jgi:hypothetical protein
MTSGLVEYMSLTELTKLESDASKIPFPERALKPKLKNYSFQHRKVLLSF